MASTEETLVPQDDASAEWQWLQWLLLNGRKWQCHSSFVSCTLGTSFLFFLPLLCQHGHLFQLLLHPRLQFPKLIPSLLFIPNLVYQFIEILLSFSSLPCLHLLIPLLLRNPPLLLLLLLWPELLSPQGSARLVYSCVLIVCIMTVSILTDWGAAVSVMPPLFDM